MKIPAHQSFVNHISKPTCCRRTKTTWFARLTIVMYTKVNHLFCASPTYSGSSLIISRQLKCLSACKAERKSSVATNHTAQCTLTPSLTSGQSCFYYLIFTHLFRFYGSMIIMMTVGSTGSDYHYAIFSFYGDWLWEEYK